MYAIRSYYGFTAQFEHVTQNRDSAPLPFQIGQDLQRRSNREGVCVIAVVEEQTAARQREIV